jgi:cytoskeleton protein RodZ
VPEVIEESLPPPPAEEQVPAATEAAPDSAPTSPAPPAPGAIAEEDLPPPAPEPTETTPAVEDRVSEDPVPPEQETTSTDDAAPTPEAEVAAAPPARSRIILQATSESFIRVTDAEGAVLIEKLLLMGEIYRVPNREGLVLDTGNAGALKILVDGRPAPSLGEDGEIRRNIPLSPDTLEN